MKYCNAKNTFKLIDKWKLDFRNLTGHTKQLGRMRKGWWDRLMIPVVTWAWCARELCNGWNRGYILWVTFCYCYSHSLLYNGELAKWPWIRTMLLQWCLHSHSLLYNGELSKWLWIRPRLLQWCLPLFISFCTHFQSLVLSAITW